MNANTKHLTDYLYEKHHHQNEIHVLLASQEMQVEKKNVKKFIPVIASYCHIKDVAEWCSANPGYEDDPIDALIG